MTASLCSPPPRDCIARSMDICVRTYAWGRISEFSSRISHSYQEIWSWLKGESLPAIDTIMRICFKLGISPLLFLRGLLDDKLIIPDIHANRIIDEQPPNSSSNSFVKLTRNEVEHELRGALKVFPPLSLKNLMEKTGWGRGRLKRWFPELCAAIIAKHREFYRKRINIVNAENILRIALKESPPPSLKQLMKRIGCKNTGTLHDHFPDLTKALMERYNKYWYKQVDWKYIELRMREALKENPPPSLKEVARRLNLGDPPYHKFYDLCKAISSKYISYIKSKSAKRRELLRQGIQEAVTKIVEKGLHPSRIRVNQMLSITINPAEFAAVIRELKKNQI